MRLLILLALPLAGCGASSPSPSATAPASPTASAPAAAPTSPAPASSGASPATSAAATSPAEGCALFAERGFVGTFALYTPADGRTRVCAPARAAEPFLPASTFKVANALIGLETGAVRDPEALTPWDGVDRGVPAWNADTSLASGMRNSTVWYYQLLASRIGAPRMRDYLARLGYGNADIGPDDAVTHFWLDGALRISALEQLRFLDALRRGALPVSAESQATVARILELDRGPGWVLRAKSGAVLPIDDGTGALEGPARAGAVGWWVGWVDRGGDDDAVFALNLALTSMDDLPAREAIARALLAANGAL